MWNLKCSNRILDMRAKQQAHLRHIRALKKVKSTIKNKEPQHYQFLDIKAKTFQKSKQRHQQIEHQNSILVNRMITMPSTLESIHDVYFKQSLNSAVIRKRERRIDTENQKLVRRLQSANSQYSQKAMSRSINSYYRSKTQITTSKMDQYYDFQNLEKYESQDDQDPKQKLARSRPFSAKK